MARAGRPYTSVKYRGLTLLDGTLQSFFQGIILAQGVSYWQNYKDDSGKKRLYVGVVIVLTVIQTVLQNYKVWRVTIFGKPWSTSSLQWSDILLNSIICSLAGAFFIRRCWKIMERRSLVLYPLALLSLTIFVAGVYLAVTSQRLAVILPTHDEKPSEDGLDLLSYTSAAFTYWVFASLALDIIMTSILITRLWRSRTGLVQSDRAIRRIITITWEAAVPPSVFMLISGSLYRAAQNSQNQIAMFFALLTGKLYTLGLLRTLNSRITLRGNIQTQDLGRQSLGNWLLEQETVPVAQIGVNPSLNILNTAGPIIIDDCSGPGPPCGLSSGNEEDDTRNV